jgi:hypothetical protein
MTEAFPLQWPDGWPRAKRRDHDRKFHGRVYGLAPGRARDQMLDELRQLGAKEVVVSSNVALRRDGLPYSQQARLIDPGVAVYFKLRGRPLVMAQDRFESVAGNMRSLALAIAAMRQLARHGGGTMMERAFTGFAAIAPPDWKKPWREVFGIKPDWHGDITKLYREKARHRHPDAGGNDALMAELNIAYAEAKREFGMEGEQQ